MTKAKARIEVIKAMRQAHDELHQLILQAENTPAENFEQICLKLERIVDDLLEPAADQAFVIADAAIDTSLAADAASVNMDEEPGRPKPRPQGAYKADDFA